MLLKVLFRRDIQNPSSTDHSKVDVPYSRPSPELPDLEQPHATSPRARLLLRRPSAGSVLSPGPASYSAPMPERLPTA